MKYKILRLVESTNTDIKRMKQDLYARERQALKDLGDPKWEDLVGLKNRLPEDQFNAFMIEEGKIRTIEMIHSILTYTDPDYWTVDNVMSNKYMKKYIDELGEDVVSDIVNQEVEEYKNNAIIDRDTYTDSEGVTYNSVRFKNESAITEAIKKHNFKVTKNNIDEGIYFVKREEAEEYIKECKARGLTGNYKIVKLNKDLTEDVDTGKDLENDTVDEVVDDMQDETSAEEEEESSTLDNQLEDLREVLPDLDLNLYQVTNKEDKNKVFYFIGKVADDSNDLLMLIDKNPSEDNQEPSIIDDELPEEKAVDDLEVNELEDDNNQAVENDENSDESTEDRFDFMKVPSKYDDLATMNPRYGDELNPDHEAIMEYLMKCLVEVEPEKAEELAKENNIDTEKEDNTKLELDDRIQADIDNKIEHYSNNLNK